MKQLRHLFRFLIPFRWQVLLAIILGAAVIASNVGLLGAAGYLIAAAAARHSLILLLIPISLVRLLSVTRGLARYAERLVAHHVTFRILARLRAWLYDGLTRLGPATALVLPSGDALGRLMRDVEEMQNAYLRLVSPYAVAILIAALVLGILGIFSTALAGVAAIFLIAAGLGIPLLVWILGRGLGHHYLAARADLNADLIDSIQGVQDILSHGHWERQLQHVTIRDRVVGRIEGRMAMINAGREALTDLLGNLAVLATLTLTILWVADRPAETLYLAVPTLVVLASFETIRPLGLAAQSFDRVHAAGSRILSITERQPLAREPDTAISPPTSGSLGFDHVTLTYPQAHKPALQDITLTVPSGARIAVVGPSGAGKTSLVQLIVRAWNPSDGAISLDGADIREYRLTDLRSVTAVVSQETHIFDDTVRNNLLMARPGATEAELIDALEAAQLLETVQALPQGLDTPVGEHGTRLSGGERQRLSIARALLKNAPLLILDEPTANLDPMTEWEVLATLYRLMRGRTALMVTHRLIGLENMDEIAVLDQGRIVERGTHAELCAHGGLYRDLLEVQENMLSGTLL